MAPAERRSGPPPARAARDIKAPETALDVPTVPLELAPWRCWRWRARHACGCGRPADCMPNDPGAARFGQPSSYSLSATELAAHVRQLRRQGWQGWEVRQRFDFTRVA
jgi:hypothetical protein